MAITILDRADYLMSPISRWMRLCIAIVLLAGADYWVFNHGHGAFILRLPSFIYASLTLTFLPGFLVAGLISGSIHNGLGDGVIGTAFTAVCSGFVWGSLLYLSLQFFRSVKRRVLNRPRT